MEPLRCALVLPPDKLGKVSELAACPVDGVKFAAEDGAAAEAATPPDAVVHKAVFDLAHAATDDAAAARLRLLRRYDERGVLLDLLERSLPFADRGEICRLLASLHPEAPQPAFLELRDADADVVARVREAMAQPRAGEGRLRYPLMCKPLLACGPASSHELAVVLREEGLAALRPPLLLQNFVRHGGALLKGYCVGRRVHVAQRASLPDLVGGAAGPAVVQFDSRQPYPTAADFGAAVVPPPPEDGGTPTWEEQRAAVERLVRAVSARLRVNLLGIDVLPAVHGGLLIVDVNYFPVSTASFPSLPEALAEAVRDHAEQRQRDPGGALNGEYANAGYVVMPSACSADEIAPLRAEVDAARHELARGGYRIWSPASELPPALRAWSETRGLELAARALPPNAQLTCLGGAALLKIPGDLPVGTPFHQDEAYAAADHDGAASKSRNSGKSVCALWLALSPADDRSGCLRFVPSLGYDLLPHEKLSRDEAPSGFEHFLTRGSAAEAAAERDFVSVPVAPGDALVIGGRVVHGSHAAVDGERVAFSPLYEYVVVP